MLALILTTGAYATPVVCDGPSCEGDPAAAIALVAERGRLDPTTLSAVPLEKLRAHPPVLLAGGAAESCTGTPLTGGAQMALDSAEGALLYGRFEEAAAGVTNARQAVLCASEPTSSATIARIELVAGLIAQEQGDEAAATARYAAAIRYDPSVPWPSTYPSDRRTLFDAARSDPPPPETSLTVRPSTPAPSVDGAPLGGPLRAGEHIVRSGTVAVRIALDEVPNRLIIPAAYPENALSWAGDEARRPELSALLAATIGEGTEAWIVSGADAWRAIAGRTDWASFPGPAALPQPHLPDPDPLPTSPKRRPRWALAATGSAIAIVGLGAAAIGTIGANETATHWKEDQAAYEAKMENTAPPTEPEPFDRTPYERSYKLGIVTAGVGWGLARLGTGATALGLVWWRPL